MSLDLRHLSLSLSIVASVLGCRQPSAVIEPSPELAGSTSDAAPAGELAPWLVLPWGTVVATAPGGQGSWRLRGPAGDAAHDAAQPGRVVRLVGAEGDWWVVETVAHHELAGANLDSSATPIEGLEFFTLRLYVPAGTGQPLWPPEPEPLTPGDAARLAGAVGLASSVGLLGVLASDPPLQSGELRPLGTTLDHRVSAGAKAYWPDGRAAGTVTGLHAYLDPGRTVSPEAGLGPLRCFELSQGPGADPGGELCFEASAVVEATPMQDSLAALWGDDSLDSLGGLGGYDDLDGAIGVLSGGSVDGGYGLGGSGGGFGGGGGGGGGTGEGIGALGGVGTVGRGGGGASYGAGTGTLAKPPEPTCELHVASLEAQGPDADAARRVVEVRTRTLDACVAAAEDRGAAPERIVLTLEVDADGRVGVGPSSVEVGDDDDLRGCIAQKVARWRFASAAPGQVKVELRAQTP